MLERHCEHVLDTDALSLLPDVNPKNAVSEPLQPHSDDEYAHPASAEPLWNESWYFDFADARQGIGGYLRLGLTPNEGVAWFTALLCGPGRATVAVIDFRAPLPANAFELSTERFDFTQHVAEPLRDFRIRLSGKGQAYDDAAGLLRGDAGRPAELSMDLQWISAGAPYQYRLTTRYEIPCVVSGTVETDGQSVTIDAAAGQRDHSWGVRDWWGMDWVWSAMHLDDGTHLHGVDLRPPGMTPFGVGYIQRPGEPLTELRGVTARETFADDGLPRTAALMLTPGELEVVADIRGHGPLRLVAADGRVAQFARAWATVSTSDGHDGVGWFEWNRNLGR
jgi:hypothetical protein